VKIRAVPRTYRGVRFRSTLEADWAANLDALGIAWQYEPEAVQLPSGELYRPDFYLPECTTWLEVKGPHNDRLEKTFELGEAARHYPECDRIDHRPEITLSAFSEDELRQYEPVLAAAPDGETRVTLKLRRYEDETHANFNYRSQVLRTIRLKRGISLDRETAAALSRGLWQCCGGFNVPWRMVVIGRAPQASSACWESAQGVDILVIRCMDCGKHSFFDETMQWVCRRCDSGGKVYLGGSYRSAASHPYSYDHEQLRWVRA
jgi:hypothetical protein